MDALVEEDTELIERTGEFAEEDVTDEEVDVLIEAEDDPHTDITVPDDVFEEMVSAEFIFTHMVSLISFSLINFISFSRVSKIFSVI